MKNILLVGMFCAVFAALHSCKSGEASNMPQMQMLRDSIFNTYATVGAIKMKVENGSHLHLVLGDAKLYAATTQDQQKEADDIAKLALRIFGKESSLRTGKLIVTKNERNEDEQPKDGKEVPMHFE